MQLDQPVFKYVVAIAIECVIDDNLNNTELTSDNLIYYKHS